MREEAMTDLDRLKQFDEYMSDNFYRFSRRPEKLTIGYVHKAFTENTGFSALKLVNKFTMQEIVNDIQSIIRKKIEELTQES